jgi:ubiquinone/menaquinone biosynthesis C-methylase UbiE
MKRVVEKESMDDSKQVQAYFEAKRETYMYMFKIGYCTAKKKVPDSLLDIGCGPGDLTLEFAKLHPDIPVTGIDTSAEMLALAEERDNLTFKQISVTEVTDRYDRIISSLALHHFHNPMDFWNSIKRINPRDVYIIDIVRPETEEKLQQIINAKPYTPEFKLDYENSLRAAFTIEEIKEQLNEVGFEKLHVMEVDQQNLNMDLVLITGAMLD